MAWAGYRMMMRERKREREGWGWGEVPSEELYMIQYYK